MAGKIDPETGRWIIELVGMVTAFLAGLFGRKKKKKPKEEPPTSGLD